MKKLFLLLALCLSTYVYPQCETAIPFDEGCDFFDATPGPITSCYYFYAPSTYVLFEFYWLANCQNPVRTYTLYDINCDSLESNQTGDFMNLTYLDYYIVCFTLECDTNESITALCASEESALPVELIYFNIVYNIPHIQLSWITATETDCMRFHVEMSKDLSTWEEIGTRDGQGTCLTETKYKFNYKEIQNCVDLNYYRLAIEDFNGNQTYSDVVPFTGPESEYYNFLNGFDLVGRKLRVIEE